jgi:hypothetical protein
MGNKNEIKTDPTTPARRKPFDITDPSFTRTRSGIWQVITMKEPLSAKIPGMNGIKPVPFALIHRFLRDVYMLNPLFMTVYMVTKMWAGMQAGITLNVSGNLLMVVSVQQYKASQ